RKKFVTGVPSGLLDVDRITEGFHPGHLIVMGGRRGTCKTALATTICMKAAMNEFRQVPTLFFSMEITAEEAVLRMICTEAAVNPHHARTGLLQASSAKCFDKHANGSAKRLFWLTACHRQILNTCTSAVWTPRASLEDPSVLLSWITSNCF